MSTGNPWEDIDFSDITPESIPHQLRTRAAWMAGKRIDNRKQAYAPWNDHPTTEYYRDPAYERPNRDQGHPEWSWNDPINWTDFATAAEWVRNKPDLDYYAFIIQREGDPYRWNGKAHPVLLFDWDDVRDPKTGRIITEVPNLLTQLTDSTLTFTEISFSWGGHPP